MRIPKMLLAAIMLFSVSQSLLAQSWSITSGSYTAPAPVAAVSGSPGFTQMWHDNALIWKYGNSSVGGMRFGSATDLGANNWTERMRISDNGFVGIGTQSPGAPLSLVTSQGEMASFRNSTNANTYVAVANNTGSVGLGIGASTPHGYLYSNTSKFFIGADGNPTLFVDGMSNGNVGIGTTDTKTYKLAVNGSAIFTKVVVKTYPWPDYVFQTNYRLRPLSEVEQYINEHHHLPEVASAEEVEKNGLDVGDNQAALLKKIEELTLYVIEQNKKIEVLEVKLKTLEKKSK